MTPSETSPLPLEPVIPPTRWGWPVWERDEVLREHCGSLVRRVWCVHCDSYNENITQRVFSCTGCGKPLVVRDHYSRLMGAFMGVQGDAEVPGELPEPSDLDT